MLRDKKIIIAVSAGIAIYKVLDLVSRLKKEGALIQVIMTENATKFVSPLTFRHISNNDVLVDMWQEPKRWNVEHIEVAKWADLFVVVPATANIVGKISHGIADDMLSTTVMAATCSKLIVPAMNTNMYLNPIVQTNLNTLRNYAYNIMTPSEGFLACGDAGMGRMPEAIEILAEIKKLLTFNQYLSGKKILVTAAGTREAIDPVRYIGNRSSGKMGYAIAEAAFSLGAEVTLISGPSTLTSSKGINLIKVETACEMRNEVLNNFKTMDIVIKAAAVADYRPSVVANQKIKKSDETLTINLVKNPDILYELGQNKSPHQLLIGFAAETNDLLAHASQKLTKKNLDIIIANNVNSSDIGFDSDNNCVKLLYRSGLIEDLPMAPKKELAYTILEKIYNYYTKVS